MNQAKRSLVQHKTTLRQRAEFSLDRALQETGVVSHVSVLKLCTQGIRGVLGVGNYLELRSGILRPILKQKLSYTLENKTFIDLLV